MLINKDKPFYTITQVAELLDMSADRLRTYDEENLVFPFRRLKDKKRLYSEMDIEWIRDVRFLISKNRMNIYSFKLILKLLKEIPDNNIHKLMAGSYEDTVIDTLIRMKANPNFSKLILSKK